MQINDILSKMNINISTNNATQMQNVEGVKNVAAEPQVQESNLYNLAEGEVFSGTVSEGENQKVLVTLSNGDTFTARPESGVELLKDQTAYFLVTSNDKGKMSLKLLTQNENASPTILKALGTAGFEVTDRAIDMVKSMMDKNLPLDPDTVGSMVKNAVFFEGESTDTLATLKKLGISINDMNIEQLKAYDNGEGKLETPLGSITKELPEIIAKSDDAGVAIRVATALTEEVRSSESTVKEANAEQLKQDITNTANDTTKPTEAKQGEVKEALKLNPNEYMDKPATGDSAPKVNIEKLIQVVDREVGELVKQELTNAVKGEAASEVIKPGDTVAEPMKTGESAAEIVKTSEEVAELTETGENAKNIETVKNAAIIKEVNNLLNQELTKADIPVNDKVFTKLLNELLSTLKENAVPEEAVKELFKSSSVKELLSKTMQEQWFMDPNKVEDKEEIDKFYNKMNRQLTRIQEAINGNKNVPAELAKNVADIKNNLSFINEANHLYQYVQIPIKMASEHATGDLYVYTNKKNLRDPKQEITAHLHLEMEHLGTTDVDILLRQKKLSTHFVLADEDSLNLVLEHIDILTQRLSDKGFDVNIDASKMQDEKDAGNDFLSKLMGMPLPKINYSKQSFDVKV